MLDESGNRLLVGNLGIAGGIQAFKLIADSSGELHRIDMPYALKYECTINGVKCVIQECVYGGLLVGCPLGSSDPHAPSFCNDFRFIFCKGRVRTRVGVRRTQLNAAYGGI